MMVSRSYKAIRVLVVSGRTNHAVEITDAFTGVEDVQVVGVVTRPDQAIKLAEQAQIHVALIDDTVPEATPSSVTRALVTALPSVAVVVLTSSHAVDEVRLSMLAGARGFLMQPFSAAELMATVRQIFELEASRQALSVSHAPAFAPQHKAKIITVAGLKGGVGRTMVASNLAVALQDALGKHNAGVVVVDGHLGAGDIGSVLNLRPLHTLADLLARGGELDRDVMDAILTTHPSGLRVLLPASQFNGLEVVEPYHMEQVLTQLQQMCEYIVVDTGPALDRTTLVMLDMADMLLVVTTPEIPSLLRTSLFLDSGRSWGYSDAKMQLVLNRANNKGGIPLADVEAHLRTKVALTIPDDAALVTYSINRGVPLAMSDKRSLVAAALIELARRIMGGEPTKQAAQKSEGLIGRLSNLRMPGAGISTAAVQPGASKVNMVGWSSSK